LGFWVWEWGFGVRGAGFGVWGSECVLLGLEVSGLGYWVSDLKVWFAVRGSGFGLDIWRLRYMEYGVWCTQYLGLVLKTRLYCAGLCHDWLYFPPLKCKGEGEGVEI